METKLCKIDSRFWKLSRPTSADRSLFVYACSNCKVCVYNLQKENKCKIYHCHCYHDTREAYKI